MLVLSYGIGFGGITFAKVIMIEHAVEAGWANLLFNIVMRSVVFLN